MKKNTLILVALLICVLQIFIGTCQENVISKMNIQIGSLPQVSEKEFHPEITGKEGDFATLQCGLSESENSTFTWKKNGISTNGLEPRVIMVSNGSALLIISLDKTDSGTYVCTVNKKSGRPRRKEIKLVVQDPIESPACILNTPELSPTIVPLGSSVTLNCYVNGYPKYVVIWFKNNKMLPLRTREFRMNKHQLLINSITLDNLGSYTCQAYNGIGKPVSWSVSIEAVNSIHNIDSNNTKLVKNSVEKSQEIEIRTTYPVNSVMRYNTTPRPALARANITIKGTKFPLKSRIEIPCEVDGYPVPQVQWYKDGGQILPLDRITITDKHHLIIKDAAESDGGEYKCEARNIFSSATSTTMLLIQGFPPLVIENSFIPEVTSREGDYVTLQCAISGNPNPTFTWKKDNLPINGTEPRFRLILNGSALQIIPLYKHDSGIYRCTANNKIVKSLTNEIKLVVQGPARILNDAELSSVTASLGLPATLNCYVYGYPKVSVIWWKNNMMIPMQNQESRMLKNGSLHINSVMLHNLGVYTCQAYNGLGKPSSWSVTLQEQ